MDCLQLRFYAKDGSVVGHERGEHRFLAFSLWERVTVS